MAARCSFCGATSGPFTKVEGLFTVLMCADCQAARGYGSGPYPVMTRSEMRAGLDLLPLGVGAEGGRQPPAHRGHAPAPGRRGAGGPACTRSRGWPGWSAKPRSPRTWSPSATRQPSATTDVVAAPRRPLPCESAVQDFAAQVNGCETAADLYVRCRLLSFAVPPGSADCGPARPAQAVSGP